MQESMTSIALLGKKGDPWFDDGNIILVTEDQQTAFKIHRGVVARYSEIFKGMFELPQPDTLTDSVEGCQIVPMYDNSVELSRLVKAIYDGPSFSENSLEDFYYVAGIIRLSSKYFISHLRKEAVRFLTQTWPYTLQAHDEMVEKALRNLPVNGFSYPYVHPIHVLNLAREANIRLIIPSALYFLSLYPLTELLRADHAKLMVDHPSRPSSTLDAGDIKDYTLVFQSRINLILEFTKTTCGQQQPGHGCENQLDSNSCKKGFVRLSSRLSKSWVVRTSPLHFMRQAVQLVNDDPSVCIACRLSFRRDTDGLREAFWNDLPIMVGLPSWEELCKEEL